MHLTCSFIGIFTKILLREQLLHDRLGLVVDNALLATVHLLNNALGCGVIARGLAGQQVLAYLTVREAHGEVGIAVVRHILLHA